jgi:hypothetical protein
MATPPIASATSGSAHHHPTAAFVMSQLGHTDPAFTLPVYAQAMRRDEGAKELLKALVNGVDLALTGTGSPDPSANAPEPAEPSNDETPADAEASRPWARLVSNQRPLACEASALPLSYAPQGSRHCRGGSLRDGPC